jgi:hypothetical protein
MKKILFNSVAIIIVAICSFAIKVEAADAKSYYLPDCGIFDIKEDYNLDYHEINTENCNIVVDSWNNDPYWEICGMSLDTLIYIKQNATMRSITDDRTCRYKAEINDYLALNCIYAEDWSKNNANTAWGALIYHEAQCSGYARATKALCDAVGIPCYYIHADTGSHQWNKVMIEGNWYVLDTQISLSSLNVFFLVSDEVYTDFSGYTCYNSNAPVAEKNYSDFFFRDNVVVK